MPSLSNKKQLKFVITLGTGKFGSSENNQVTIQGLRATVDIDKAGGVQMSTLKAKIYGVSQSIMNSCVTLQWRPDFIINNTVQVFAVDGTAETLVFAGNIVNAWGDYQGMPDAFLHIQAQAAYFAQLQPVKPYSIKGGIDVAIPMAKIAADMGLKFENNGVNVVLTDVYLAYSLKDQALEIAKAADIDLYIDDEILAITPRYMPRNGDIPLISAKSGMIGYPTFDGIGVNTAIMFNPAVKFGGQIKIETEIPHAAGQWTVVSLAHRLESEKPNGLWQTQIRGSLNGFAIVK